MSPGGEDCYLTITPGATIAPGGNGWNSGNLRFVALKRQLRLSTATLIQGTEHSASLNHQGGRLKTSARFSPLLVHD